MGTSLLIHGRTIIHSTKQAFRDSFQQNPFLHFVFLVWEIYSRQIEAIFASSGKQPQSGKQLIFGFHQCPVQNHIISPVLMFILNVLSTNNCWFKSRKCCFVFPADWFLSPDSGSNDWSSEIYEGLWCRTKRKQLTVCEKARMARIRAWTDLGGPLWSDLGWGAQSDKSI